MGSTFRVRRRQVALCPIRKADESCRVQRVRGGNPRFAFWAEVRALLEVLKRLPYFGRSREKRVVDVGWHLLHLKVVALRVQRADEIVPRVHAAAHGEIAPVGTLIAGSEGRRNGPSEVVDITGVYHPRRGINGDRPAAASTRALPVKCGSLSRPPLSFSASGSVDQIKC